MAQFTSNLKKKKKKKKNCTGRKRPTMAMRLGFLIEKFFVKLSQVFYRDSHTNHYIVVGFPSH